MTTLFQNFRNYQISLMLIIFLITLESFYSYYLSYNLVYILALIFLILEALSKIDKIKKKDFRLPNNFLIFFLIIFLLSIISHIYYKPNIEYKFFFKTLYVLIFIYCLAISIKNENLRNILSIILLIHSGLLIIQFITFYLFFVQIDFFNLVWGLEQKGAHLPYRFDRSFGSNFLDLKRFSGLFNEPGTYCNVIGILSCLLSNIKDLNKFHKIILCISSLSLLLTFSVYGYLFFIIILISYTYNYYSKFNTKNIKRFKFLAKLINLKKELDIKNVKRFKFLAKLINLKKKISFNNFIIVLIIFIILYFFLNFSFPYFKSRFFDYSHQSGLSLRLSSFIVYFNNLLDDWFLLVVGKGFINDNYALMGTGIAYDNTLFIYMLSRSGIIIVFICLIFSLYLLKFNKPKLCTFSIIMLSKLSLFSPIVLFGLYMIIHNFNDKK
jgi:hypothetical protein